MFALNRAVHFDPRTPAVAAGRSLVAVAQLTVILFTSDAGLFAQVPGSSNAPRCVGLSATSLWCVGGPGALTVRRLVAIAVLVVVATGYRPRLTCLPHWYVTFSLGAAMYAPNGGEHAADVLVLLLIPICLADGRVWQWRTPEIAPAPWWRGSAFAAHCAIRGQVAVIYGESVIGKLRDSSWRDGTAMHYAFQNAYFGSTAGVARFFESGLLAGWAMLVMTWSVLLVEAFLATSALCGRRVRRIALGLGAALHIAIAVVLGLTSFGLIMIGLLAVSAGALCGPKTSSVLVRGNPGVAGHYRA